MSSYLTLEQFRAVAGTGEIDVDPEAQRALDAAEESVNDYCGREFGQSATAVARYYTARAGDFVVIDDLIDLDTLKTDGDGDWVYEEEWTASDYALSPYNAATDGEPYTRIERNPNSTLDFPGYRRGIEVTGQWGWPAVPARVEEAVALQALRWLKRGRDAPFGIESVGLDGQVVRLRAKLDVDVEVMLTGLRRNVVKMR